MAAINFPGTAELQSSVQQIPSIRTSHPTLRSHRIAPPLLDWLVRLTERVHALAARCGQAQARCGFAPWGIGFLSDAAGGGSRTFEAARTLGALGPKRVQ